MEGEREEKGEERGQGGVEGGKMEGEREEKGVGGRRILPVVTRCTLPSPVVTR